MKNYIIIFTFTIIPSALLFLSGLEKSKQVALVIIFGGMFLTFLNWKKDSNWRVRDFIDKNF